MLALTDLQDFRRMQRWRTATAKVAMIGAGQLARMTHQAATDLDIELRVLAASIDDSAVRGGAQYKLGSTSQIADLEAVATGADVVTFDHELVPASNLLILQQHGHILRPGPTALSFAQDKLKARQALSEAGLPTPAFSPVSSISDVNSFAEQYGWPLMLKSRRGGYDGRGVHMVQEMGQLTDLLDEGHLLRKESSENSKNSKNFEFLVEQFVDIASELSILVARTPKGEVAVYPAIQTVQQDGILKFLLMPAHLPSPVLQQAREMAVSIAHYINAIGILAVEMFLAHNGRLLINELALRPHNSGHATIEACNTSQFHQHLRAILDWPLGSTDMRVPAAAMVNLIGGNSSSDLHACLPKALSVPEVAVHLYSKAPRTGRKFGHITATDKSTEDALQKAMQAAECFMR